MTAPQHDVSRPAAAQGADPGAGSRLREARVAAGLSVEEVATRLHLYPKTIAHIEGDDYAHLPAPTFVRGYLRAYARLLELPPGPIVEAFDRHGLEAPALVADIASNNQARSGDFPVRMATYLIVLGLGALVVVWWQNQGADPLTARLAEAPMTSEELEATQTDTLAADAVPDGGSAERSAASDTPDAAAEAGDPAGVASGPRPLAGPVRDSVRGAASAVPDAREAPAETTQPAGPDPARTVTAAPAPRADEAARPDGSRAATTGVQDASTDSAAVVTRRGDARPSPESAVEPRGAGAPDEASTRADGGTLGDDTLRMHFQHDSWVEVYGGEGARLYYDLARKGQILTVRGNAPFRVLLGYARGVRVEYNGVRFDHTPHIRGDIARFELGQDVGTQSNDGAESTVAQTPAFSPSGR
ncbi:MAG: helix-turn-helix domain-containing protein [Gammaproteobacteria bacterium]|nr:helix-turn-helix domain-containing protein [Gammaproteobacteria bacterium]NIR81862.1 helix-turn-helix domain-containing protein [Gammaproteobacteria bacterium]NIR88694.1 helix-turn-helix domain-containing protein [Gammaproteobacteria bacterium]NIU02970.1 helix-turn-helix domain-containing protein [Gammaproteobacteria bacterium]NIV50491.1 DUF4115 domain-containing protein [Gammaproteobacteria bacterium]